jgi:hypothetical protein
MDQRPGRRSGLETHSDDAATCLSNSNWQQRVGRLNRAVDGYLGTKPDGPGHGPFHKLVVSTRKKN